MENNKSIVILLILIIFTIAGIMILDQYEDNRGKVETGETTTKTTEILTTEETTTTVKTTKKKNTIKFTNVSTASKEEYIEYAKQKSGYNDTQMQCLIWLWDRESGWNPNSYDKERDVCGIPQSHPCNKIRKAKGSNSWQHQIEWGIDYINSKYMDPCSAWNHYKNSRPHGY